MSIEAWIWVESAEGLVNRSANFGTNFARAKRWLCDQIANNPEATEYGIEDIDLDHGAMFLSAAIQDRCGCDVVGRRLRFDRPLATWRDTEDFRLRPARTH